MLIVFLGLVLALICAAKRMWWAMRGWGGGITIHDCGFQCRKVERGKFLESVLSECR